MPRTKTEPSNGTAPDEPQAIELPQGDVSLESLVEDVAQGKPDAKEILIAMIRRSNGELFDQGAKQMAARLVQVVTQTALGVGEMS